MTGQSENVNGSVEERTVDHTARSQGAIDGVPGREKGTAETRRSANAGSDQRREVLVRFVGRVRHGAWKVGKTRQDEGNRGGAEAEAAEEAEEEAEEEEIVGVARTIG